VLRRRNPKRRIYQKRDFSEENTDKNRIERYDYFESLAEIPSLNEKGEYEYKDYVVSFDVEVYTRQNKFKTYKIKNIDLLPLELTLKYWAQ
jgi:hypothetical protein